MPIVFVLLLLVLFVLLFLMFARSRTMLMLFFVSLFTCRVLSTFTFLFFVFFLPFISGPRPRIISFFFLYFHSILLLKFISVAVEPMGVFSLGSRSCSDLYFHFVKAETSCSGLRLCSFLLICLYFLQQLLHLSWS